VEDEQLLSVALTATMLGISEHALRIRIYRTKKGRSTGLVPPIVRDGKRGIKFRKSDVLKLIRAEAPA